MLRESRDSEWIPGPELESRQRMQLRALARHAAVHSPHFGSRLRQAGLVPEDLGQPGGLQRLEPVDRRGLTLAGEDFFCRTVPVGHGEVGMAITSGSTGEPVKVRRSAWSREHWLAAGLRERLWYGGDCRGKLGVVRANTMRAEEHAEWGVPYSLLFQTGPVSARPASTSVDSLVEWLDEWQPDELLSLPSCLEGVIGVLEGRGAKLPSPKVVRTLSETVAPSLRERVRKLWASEIRDSYSSEEFGLMAIQCPDAGTYHVLEHVILEVVAEDGSACRPGETGRILVTDLVNHASPMIRYAIGDWAEVAAPCACGIPHRSIRRFVGRERNLIRLPDGSRHWPLFGFHRWGEVHPVRQFQFVQAGENVLIARLRVDRIPSAPNEQRLAEIIRESLGHPFEIRFEWHMEALPRGRGGKFEEFMCLLAGSGSALHPKMGGIESGD